MTRKSSGTYEDGRRLPADARVLKFGTGGERA
jgi:hypothetical protein